MPPSALCEQDVAPLLLACTMPRSGSASWPIAVLEVLLLMYSYCYRGYSQLLLLLPLLLRRRQLLRACLLLLLVPASADAAVLPDNM